MLAEGRCCHAKREAAMVLDEVLDRFVERGPLAVMVRGLLENALHPEGLNEFFVRTADKQYTRKLLFSTVVETMGAVACKIYDSPHAYYQDKPEKFTVSVSALYQKLNGVETHVAAGLVQQTAERLAAIVEALGAKLSPLLPGYRVRILDGNALGGTDHRLKELRQTLAGALPGKLLCVLDPERMLATHVIPCEDGHAQERSLLPQVLDLVQSGDLWIDDRNFCTLNFLFGIASRDAYFLTRQHLGLPWHPVSRLRHVGRCETGEVWEQTVRLEDEKGDLLFLRRIVVKLDQPTRDGETELALLSNVWDEKVDAIQLAELYRQRWTIETLFLHLVKALACEHPGLGYPKAALFSFCVALLAYNVLSVVKAALRAVHGLPVEAFVSLIYMSKAVSRVYEGMDIAVPPQPWQRLQTMNAEEMAAWLRHLAAKVDLNKYRKHPRGPKKPKEKPKYDPKHPHVSTARLIAHRKDKKE
jgi:hypothetical protein